MKDIAILDFGSGKITFAVGINSVDSSFVVKNFASVEYSGYYNGQWVSKDDLQDDVQRAISQSGFDFRQKTLFVVVPSEFTQIKTSGMYSDFGKRREITSSLLMQIHNKAEGIKPGGYTTLCSSAIEYVIDGNRHILDPIGEVGNSIYANMSYVFCKDTFINDVHSIALRLGFKEVKYIDGIWAIGSQLIDKRARINGAVLIDVGYASTTFALVKGDGLKYKKDKPFGIGFMIDGLANALGVDYEVAQDMMSQIILNIECDETSVYQYRIGMRNYECRSKDINKYLHSLISAELVNFVHQCIREVEEAEGMETNVMSQNSLGSINLMTEYYLTGGGLCALRGGPQFFARSIEQELDVLVGNTAGWDKPYYSSLFAAMEIAAKMKKKSTLLEKLFG
ncbi:MAG: hypothetical protein HFE33_04195 [Clostridia bacterium]|jgi:cell division ATPase FtsA|nr:hypothetical protein [Clostridia bacterium]MCI9290331.1 hypothetical protein [Clostridia bacterium]